MLEKVINIHYKSSLLSLLNKHKMHKKTINFNMIGLIVLSNSV